ncbi:uncharacterized protein LOC126834927 isoform X2 [Adelges cooleyi]|uniref:uncharacterized protein LOC126834927 isoform X2 n=1 Tax=Adelges cooleyi TaxID=133065 RepID=UPI00218035EA|nr:uncharacterized protein LOC126834927 isoform X2 [Adelges cooleyi]
MSNSVSGTFNLQFENQLIQVSPDDPGSPLWDITEKVINNYLRDGCYKRCAQMLMENAGIWQKFGDDAFVVVIVMIAFCRGKYIRTQVGTLLGELVEAKVLDKSTVVRGAYKTLGNVKAEKMFPDADEFVEEIKSAFKAVRQVHQVRFAKRNDVHYYYN